MVSFDKKIFDEKIISEWIDLIEMENLSEKINFNPEILELSKEIKSNIWKEEKKR
jgi:hypothetical protein